MRNLFLLLFCMLMLSSCFEDVTVKRINGAEYQAALAAEVIYATDKGWLAVVSQTIPVDVLASAFDNSVDVTNMELLEDDQLVARFYPDTGNTWQCDFIPRAAHIYQLRIEATGFEEVISEPVAFPDSVAIDSFTQAKDEIFVHFQDPEGLHNYAIEINQFPDTRSSSSFRPALPDRVYRDRDFDSPLQSIAFRKRGSSDYASSRLYSLSTALGHYLYTYDRYEFNYSEALADPQEVEGNLNGGIGIFGIYRSSDLHKLNY